MSENVTVRVSSIRPVFIRTVNRGQQQEAARVSVCLVAVETRLSLFLPLSFSLSVCSQCCVNRKGGEMSRACIPQGRSDAGKLSAFNASRGSVDTVGWNLCESGFSEPVMHFPSMHQSVFTLCG